MVKFSLLGLKMCAKYQKLISEDYIRLGLSHQDDDCINSVKEQRQKKDKMVCINTYTSDTHCTTMYTHE